MVAGGGASGGTFHNSIIVGNSAVGKGGGGLGGTFYNCTITGNSAGDSGGGVNGEWSAALLYNCIVYGNTAPLEENYGSADLAYSCTTPLPATGSGNITNDPQFVDGAGGDFRLLEASP